MSDKRAVLSLIPQHVKKELQVHHREELKGLKLYHIRRYEDNIFIPSVSRRLMVGEDNTVPRVSAAPTLLGCIIGYSSLYNLFMSIYDGKRQPPVFYTYDMDYTYCIKPSKKLVPDVEESDEYWLVTYDKETVKYRGKKTAVINLYRRIEEVRKSKVHTIIDSYVFTVNVISKEGLMLDKTTKLDKGHYIVTINIDMANQFTISGYEAIDEREYYEHVKRHGLVMEDIMTYKKLLSW